LRVLVDVACPLLTQFILEGGGGDTERAHEKKQTDVDRCGFLNSIAVGMVWFEGWRGWACAGEGGGGKLGGE